MKPLTILITNITLAGYTGTELVVRDLAIGLQSLGHYPMVYSPLLGGISQQIIAAGVEVVTDLALLSRSPDIIHGHHHVETMQAILHFPASPAIFVCHDSYAWHDIPPKFEAIMAYGAVSYSTQERLTKNYKVAKENTHIIYNWVDMQRFKPRQRPLSKAPKRALVFSNYAKADSQLQEIRLACEQLDIALDVLGFGVGTGSTNPETILEDYDLVFGKGKCALEAMAVGCAVVLCDTYGLGEMITRENIEDLRKWNFGMSVLKNSVESTKIANEISKYNAEDATEVANFIRDNAGLDQALINYLNLYEQVISKWQSSTESAKSISLPKHIEQLLIKMSELETMLHQPFDMQALSILDASRLNLLEIDCPQTVKVNDTFRVTVLLKNNSQQRIASYLPFPVCFSYHWLDINENKYVDFDGLRTTIKPWLEIGESAEYKVTVAAPSVTGFYRLAVSLVQEEVRWFDQLEPPIVVMKKIEIV